MKKREKILAAVIAALGAPAAEAVYLDPDGLGQALIYPYYTVRAAEGNPFNTYISVVNATPDAKAVRVRFREGRNGRTALDFNLFLGANDLWAAAVVPTAEGARLVTADRTCTDPLMATSGTAGTWQADLSNAAFAGANSDGLGDGLDRVREGYVEMIEMATLSGLSAALITHGPDGWPDDCYRMRKPEMPQPGDVGPPTGGLLGTLTLINVASGHDATVNAEALAQLTAAPFFRRPLDPYPDFNAAEVLPLSELTAGGKRYRLRWNRGVDAVSSVMMQKETSNEWILDEGVAARTDWVLTLPTRRFHVTPQASEPPFTPGVSGCEPLQAEVYSRDAERAPQDCDVALCAEPVRRMCYAASVLQVELHGAGTIFASTNLAQYSGLSNGSFVRPNGWIRMRYLDPLAGREPPGLVSAPGSTALDVRTGALETGTFRVEGLPLVGFMGRTFDHDTLACGGIRCQGNYLSAFPHRITRVVVPAP